MHHRRYLGILDSVFLVFLILFILGGCAGTGGYQEAIFKGDKKTDLNVYGMFDKEFASKYFGSFRFVFENKEDQWLHIENIKLSFADDSANKYIKVFDQLKFYQ